MLIVKPISKLINRIVFLSFIAAISCTSSETHIIITECVDDNGNLLAGEVSVNVNNQEYVWRNGEHLIIKTEINGGKGQVNLRAEADGYIMISPDTYAVTKGHALGIQLMFVTESTYNLSYGGSGSSNLRISLDPPQSIVTLTNPVSGQSFSVGSNTEIELPEGEYLYQATESGYQTSEGRVELRGRDRQLNISLIPENTDRNVTVAAVRLNIEPANAAFSLISAENPQISFSISNRETLNVPPGQYRWSASAGGHVQQSSQNIMEIREGRTRTINVNLVKLNRVQIQSMPPGAEVTLISQNTRNLNYRGTTPVTFDVVPDFYSWEMEHPGYVRVGSGLFGEPLIDAGTRDNVTLSKNLTGINVLNVLGRANNLFDQQQYGESANLYKQIPKPIDCRGESGFSYRLAQSRIGWVMLNVDRDYLQAFNAYDEVLDCDRFDYSGLLNMGITSIELNEFSAARSYLNQIIGPVQQHIEVSERPRITLMARFYLAKSHFREYERATTQSERYRIGPLALSLLEDFLVRDSRGDGMADLNREAQTMRDRIRRELQ